MGRHQSLDLPDLSGSKEGVKRFLYISAKPFIYNR